MDGRYRSQVGEVVQEDDQDMGTGRGFRLCDTGGFKYLGKNALANVATWLA